MNAAEFNTEISKTVSRAIKEGVGEKKLDVTSIIGILEWHKADITRWAQDMTALAVARQQPKIHLPNGRIPLPPMP